MNSENIIFSISNRNVSDIYASGDESSVEIMFLSIALNKKIFDEKKKNAKTDQNYYGVIVYSTQSDNYGYSYNWSTSEAAEEEAIKQCEEKTHPGDCNILVSFKNSCGSIAGGDTKASGRQGHDASTAEFNALQRCRGKYYNFYK